MTAALFDLAMQVEGIPPEKRERVRHWILYGSSPDRDLTEVTTARRGPLQPGTRGRPMAGYWVGARPIAVRRGGPDISVSGPLSALSGRPHIRGER